MKWWIPIVLFVAAPIVWCWWACWTVAKRTEQQAALRGEAMSPDKEKVRSPG